MNLQNLQERFFRYVQIDTQSDPNSESQPSTMKQKDLGRMLAQELLDMGLADAHLDEYGYVYATIPSNIAKQVPSICFCAHMDTSPDCSGTHVKPIVHKNYQGADIVLPDDPGVVLRKEEHPDLAAQLGNDIITASGTTLLGADNKAGLAAIMAATEYLLQHPEIAHGAIKILFTPDEEIGRGTAKVDMHKLGADFGYTVDGESLGTIENETFSANGMTIHIKGVSAHPGFAKGKMQSAIKIAAEILANLPKHRHSPESTEGMEGFVHPVGVEGHVEEAKIDFIIRDFTEQGLDYLQNMLKDLAEKVLNNYPGAKLNYQIQEQYRNMKQVLDAHPMVVDLALKAMTKLGLNPQCRSIRGGTDGSRLSFMGLPCANIFAGEHAFHSKEEWVSLQDMGKAAEVIVQIAALNAE